MAHTPHEKSFFRHHQKKGKGCVARFALLAGWREKKDTFEPAGHNLRGAGSSTLAQSVRQYARLTGY